MKTSPQLRKAMETALQQNDGILTPEILRAVYSSDELAGKKLRQLEAADYVTRVDVGRFAIQDTPYRRGDEDQNASLDGFLPASERGGGTR